MFLIDSGIFSYSILFLTEKGFRLNANDKLSTDMVCLIFPFLSLQRFFFPFALEYVSLSIKTGNFKIVIIYNPI